MGNPIFMVEGLTDGLGKVFFRCNSTNKKGESATKTLTYEQLMKVLGSSCQEERISVSVGPVPEGYLDALVYSTKGGVVRVYVPEKKRCFLLDNETPIPTGYIIPMPAMVFEIFYGPNGSSGRCCIVKGTYEEVKERYRESSLEQFMYPFGNVNTDGHICMGNILHDISEMSEASIFTDAFFDGITNADYLDSKSRLTNKWEQKRFLEELQKMDSFPYELLYPLSVQFLNKKL